MQKVLKKSSILSFFLLFGHTLTGTAIPCGNPSDPALLSRTTWSNVTAYKIYCDHGCKTFGSKIDIGYRVGFFGDYIFSENAGVKNVVTNRLINKEPKEITIPKIRTCNTNVTNTGVELGINFKDGSKGFFPVWDIEIYGKAGGLKNYIRLPMEAFRKLVDITQDPTFGIIEMQTNYGFSWDLGIKKILWKSCSSALSAGFEYKQASSPMDYIILQQSSEPEIYFDYNSILDETSCTVKPTPSKTSHSIRYKEWAAHLGASSEILPHFIPYVAIYTGYTTWKAGHPNLLFSALTEQYTNLEFDMRKIKNFERLGWAFGASYLLGKNTLANFEGRWGYQRAFSLNLKIQI